MTSTREKINQLRAIARKDSKYCSLLKTLRSAENRLDEAEAGMTDDQRDAMWDFFELSEEVNLRLLEIACEHPE